LLGRIYSKGKGAYVLYVTAFWMNSNDARWLLLFKFILNIFLTAIEVGVNLKDGYNGDISAKDAGKIGGQMVKKMIAEAERNMK